MPRHQKLRQEMISLYIVQATSYVAPIVIIPLLISKIGLSGYGLYALYQSSSSLVIAVVEFGFSWTATVRVSQEVAAGKHLRRVYSDHFYAQVAVLAGALVTLCPILFFVFKEKQVEPLLLVISALQAVALPISGAWLHQGLGASHRLALAQVLGRGLTLLGCLAFVHDPSDLVKAILITTVGTIVGALLPFWISLTDPRLGLDSFNAARTAKCLREAWPLFIAKISSTCYLIGLPLIIAYWATAEINGYFSLIDKVRRALLTMLAPPFQYLVPRLATVDGRRGTRLLSVSILLIVVATTLCVLMIAAWPQISSLLAKGDTDHPHVLAILAALTIPVVTVSNIVAQLILIPLGIRAAVAKISAAGAALGFISAATLLPLLPDVAPTLTLLVTESLVMVMFLITLRRRTKQKLRTEA